MTNTRILLTGCHGLLGQRIVQGMPPEAFVLGVDRDDNAYIHGEHFQYARLDITNRKEVKLMCEEYNPDWIINAAAFTNVDECEIKKELCWRVNVEGVENLVKFAKKIEAKFIHISSDYIFDGKKNLYTEEDLPSPLCYYGKAKLASENVVRASGIDWTILRTSTLYDVDALQGQQNFVTWVVKNLWQGNSIRIVTDQCGNPTLARNLATAVWQVVSLNRTGVFNAAGKDNVDRHTFAKRIAEYFDLDAELLVPVTTEELKQEALRPLRIGLDTSKIERELEMNMMGIEEGLLIFKKDYLAMHRNN